MKLSFIHQISVGFSVAIVLVVLAGAFSFQSTGLLKAMNVAVDQSQQTLNTAQHVLSLLQDAETGQRGYLLTGETSYLQPYTRATSHVDHMLTQLRALTVESPVQTQHLAELSQTITAKLAELKQTIDLHQGGHPEAALALVRMGTGQQLMDQIRQNLALLEAEEQQQLTQRQAAAEQQDRTATTATTSSLLGALLLLIYAAFRIQRDHIHRRQMEASLRASEGQLTSLVTHLPMGMGIFDRTATITLAAGGLLTAEHLNPADFVGRSMYADALSIIVGPERNVHRALHGETITFIRDTGSRVFETSYIPVPNEKGDVTSVIVMAVEITARVRAEQASLAAKAEAERANLAKSEFLSRMSHEFRTPLNAILGFAQVLEMDGLDLVQQESVDQILAGGRHLLTLINEVLDITGIESGYVSLSPEPLVLADLVAETIDLLDPLATQSHVTLDAACDQRCHQHVLADQQRLKQVLLNLLANAIKYNRPGGRVRVSCGAAAENRVRLEVRDTGVGIPQAQLPRLFTPFERLDATHTTIEGTGLGLALAKQLMEAMGGRIGVDSVVGVGTTFWIELPLIAASIDQVNGIPIHDAPTLLAPLPPVQPSRILLSIEDNLANFRLIERVLSHRPELVLLPAMQGRLGLELARQHHPDVILLDLHLPDIPGDEVLRQLRADPATAKTPVIMLSADANPRRRAELLAAGADSYVTKPLNVVQFLVLIDETLQTSRVDG